MPRGDTKSIKRIRVRVPSFTPSDARAFNDWEPGRTPAPSRKHNRSGPCACVDQTSAEFKAFARAHLRAASKLDRAEREMALVRRDLEAVRRGLLGLLGELGRDALRSLIQQDRTQKRS